MTVPAAPEPPVRGSIVQPVTPEEIAATSDHLNSDADARAWGRELAVQAGVGAHWCAAQAAEAAVRPANRP